MLRDILQHSVRDREGRGVTPGGVLLYGDEGADLATIAFGRSHLSAPPEPFDVTPATVYDIASITKPVAVAATLMKLDVDLDQPVAPWLPELRVAGSDRITLAHLLGHASGFPAHIEFFERLRAGERAGASSAREALLRMVCATELDCPPGTRVLYSDLGYIALGFAIERMTGKRLDACVRELVTGPLGMDDTFFAELVAELEEPGGGEARAPASAPHPALGDRARRIAPTEVCPHRGLVHGEVHDDNAHAGGGIHGHAGLFSTAGDLARFARAVVGAAAGGTATGAAAGDFDPAVVQRFLGRQSGPDTTWRLGWDRPSAPPALSHAGALWPADGVGHLGFTGCSLWLDPPRGRYVVLLTNRVHPSREQPHGRPGIRELRRAIMDAVVGALDAG